MSGHGADVYDPLTVRASMGSLFALPVVRLPSHREVAGVGGGGAPGHPTGPDGPGAARLQIVAGSGEAQTPLEEVDLTRPTVLVFGNETRGLSAAYRDLADVLARIPMQGAANSLNVASAATILLYEAARQRRAACPHAAGGHE